MVLTGVLGPHKPCWIRLPIGWPSECCDFADPLDYLGYDGAGGIGSGPGMAVGAAWTVKYAACEKAPVYSRTPRTRAASSGM